MVGVSITNRYALPVALQSQTRYGRGRSMAGLTLEHVGKKYPNGYEGVKDFNLDIADKEFIIFVGPSGCGKSTTLRMIAGLEDITSGTLKIDGKVVNDVEPKDRDIAMVFQNYALYPHMTVYDNMAFPLKLRKVDAAEIDRIVHETARILDLEKLLDRKPSALSGGQRQRVAMGRAIARQPKVFLMDEPLSNLDAKLRVQMRAEISKLHDRLGATIIYVTHGPDRGHDARHAHRCYEGRRHAAGRHASKLYSEPCNLFVAGFIGSPQMNFIDATVGEAAGKIVLNFGGNTVTVPDSKAEALKPYVGKVVVAGIRPEDVVEENEYAEGRNLSRGDRCRRYGLRALGLRGHDLRRRGRRGHLGSHLRRQPGAHRQPHQGRVRYGQAPRL